MSFMGKVQSNNFILAGNGPRGCEADIWQMPQVSNPHCLPRGFDWMCIVMIEESMYIV